MKCLGSVPFMLLEYVLKLIIYLSQKRCSCLKMSEKIAPKTCKRKVELTLPRKLSSVESIFFSSLQSCHGGAFKLKVKLRVSLVTRSFMS